MHNKVTTMNDNMKKLSETYTELRIAFTFPIEIKNKAGNETYFENSKGFCCKREHDSAGNETYYEDIDGFWCKREYDSSGNQTYHETSNGYWRKRENDSAGNQTYYENSKGFQRGTPPSAKTCEGKVVEVDGIKYELKTINN